MPLVTPTHVRWRDAIDIAFGFTGLNATEAEILVRRRVKEQFPDLDRPQQCVYVVRLKGDVAVAYGDDFSPVIYIGEGNAGARLYSHAKWIAELLVAVPNAAIEVRVADCVRRNDDELCQYVEADLIVRFIDKHNCLPWFNRQREKKREGKRDYDDAVISDFNQRLGKVSGSKYIWAIQPTSNNEYFEDYQAGQYDDA